MIKDLVILPNRAKWRRLKSRIPSHRRLLKRNDKDRQSKKKLNNSKNCMSNRKSKGPKRLKRKEQGRLENNKQEQRPRQKPKLKPLRQLLPKSRRRKALK